jgi:hypothetical protein
MHGELRFSGGASAADWMDSGVDLGRSPDVGDLDNHFRQRAQ